MSVMAFMIMTCVVFFLTQVAAFIWYKVTMRPLEKYEASIVMTDVAGVRREWNPNWEIPAQVMAWASDKPIRLLSFDDWSEMLTFGLLEAPGSVISYNCSHLLDEPKDPNSKLN